LKKWTQHREGKGHAKDTANFYERIEGRSGPTRTIESEAARANCTRVFVLPTGPCIIGVSCSPSKVSKPFRAVGINPHRKKKCDRESASMIFCDRSVIA